MTIRITDVKSSVTIMVTILMTMIILCVVWDNYDIDDEKLIVFPECGYGWFSILMGG